MDSADLVSVIIAFISLIVSIATAYFAYFKPAKLKMLSGRNMIIANTYVDTDSDPQWGGLSFILPLTFYNWSPKGRSIYQVRIVIEREDNHLKNFDLVWSSFVSFLDGGTRWESDALAHPIAIAGQSSLTKIVRFDWSPFRSEKIEVRTGKYNLRLYAWTSGNRKPQLKEKISFQIENEQSSQYQNSVQNNLVIPIQIPLGQARLPNNVLTRQDVENNYG